MGGFATTILGLLIEYSPTGIAYSCYLYGALPTIYFFLLWVTYKTYNTKEIGTLHIHLAICSSMFVAFCLRIYFIKLKTSLNYLQSIIYSSILFVLASLLYFKYLVNKKF